MTTQAIVEQAASTAVGATTTGLTPMQEAVVSRMDTIGAWLSGSADKIGTMVKTVGEVAYKEAIDIATQYVVYGRVYTTLYILMAIIGVILAIWIGSKVLPAARNNEEGKTIFCGMMSVSFAGTGITLFVNTIKEFLLVWFVPKIWLSIEIVNLVKTMKGN